MLKSSFLLGLCIILRWSAVTYAQEQAFDAQKQFTNATRLTSAQDVLTPQAQRTISFDIPKNYSMPDVLITVNSTSNGTGLVVYCGGRGAPQGPGYSPWSSELSTPINQIFISRNDVYYPQLIRGTSGTAPSITCLVVNLDQNQTNSYTFAIDVITGNATLSQQEQSVLSNLYSKCCTQSSSCLSWKAYSRAASGNANGGQIITDFCSFQKQICTPSGNLYRLDLTSFNMSCDFPADYFLQFKQLSSLLVAANNFTGNTSEVARTLAGLTNLQYFDGTGNSAIKGGYDNGTAQSDLCNATQNSLAVMSLNSMNVLGGIPSCLFSNGSKIFQLDLGSNQFQGSIPDTIQVNSTLQVLTVAYNLLNGSLPSTLGNAQNLVSLDVTANYLTGTIPASIGSIPTLNSFVIASNNISGKIPDSFGTSKNLQQFDVKQNYLTAFPSAWTNPSSNLTNTTFNYIRASMNNITDSFPGALASSPSLAWLVINENHINGTLPTISNPFPKLRAFNTSSNRLSGTIPATFNTSALFSSNAARLSNGQTFQQTFDLSYNKFSGNLPSFLVASNIKPFVANGIYLQGNNFNVSCQDSNFNYITSICPLGASSKGNGQSPASAPSAGPSILSSSPAVSTNSQPISVSSSSPPTSATSVTASNGREQSSGSKGLSGGAIAGIIIGVLAALAVIAVAAVLIIQRRKSSGSLASKFSSGEIGRRNSLKKSLATLTSNPSSKASSRFERFDDEDGQHNVELSPSNSKA